MSYLGIDFGLKRIGLAMCENDSYMAFPFIMLENGKDTFSELKKIIKDKTVEVIVMGLPLNLSMQESDQSMITRKFGDALSRESGIKVVYENEIFSTLEAEKYIVDSKNRKRDIDKISASLILQSYLDKVKINFDKIN